MGKSNERGVELMNHPILIVDDERKLVEVISAYLQAEGLETIAAYNGKEALEQFRQAQPRLIILDLMLPDVSGEEVCQAIRRQSAAPILMLTAKSGENDRIHGLSIGADDYLVKPFSARELVARVKTILRRSEENSLLADRISYREGELVIDTASHEVSKHGSSVGLTPSEYKLLITLARHPHRVFERGELIERVFGFDYDGDERMIDTHVKNIRQKIETNPRKPAYIITVFGAGYKFEGE